MEWINQFATVSTLFDELIALLTNNVLLKGGVIIALFYWAWFSSANQSRERNILLTTLLSAPVIVLVARMLALYLPFRFRPLHSPDIEFTLPTGVSQMTLDGWSSFPSDHAVLFIAISVGIFAASRRIGLVAIFYTLLFICLPRIYVGYHYPTDILAGCIIGGALVRSATYVFADGFIIGHINNLSEKYTGAFYALFFLVGSQIANLFDQSREIVSMLLRTVSQL